MSATKTPEMIDALYRAIEKNEVAVSEGKITRIRQWKIENKLGSGATANVYLGKSLIDDSLVAIKVFKREYFANDDKNDANQKMIRTEAALVGKIVHPHILQTYTVGLKDDIRFLVMECVGHGCLEDYVHPPKTFNLQKLIHIFFQCGLAFQYSDEIGVIHRDIKPANILLAANDIAKVSDFGSSMVKGMEADAVSGIGSPAYMSSEQMRQESLNQQTDIYSLGATFFELLTGQKTLQAETQKELIYKVLFAEAPPVSQYITSQLPNGLEEIIAKCLKKKQEERYQSWLGYLVDMSELIYRITPPAKRYQVIETVSAYDWIRKSKMMDIFADSEIWDLLQNGLVYKVSIGMAFSVSKKIKTQQESLLERKLDALTLATTQIMSKEAIKEFMDSSGSLIHNFVLQGTIQSYGAGEDGRIQILGNGDYCANINFIDNFNKNKKAQAFSIEDTVLFSVDEQKILEIHPVVREKLNNLISASQNNQLETLKRRHAKVDIHQAVKAAAIDMRLL